MLSSAFGRWKDWGELGNYTDSYFCKIRFSQVRVWGVANADKSRYHYDSLLHVVDCAASVQPDCQPDCADSSNSGALAQLDDLGPERSVKYRNCGVEVRHIGCSSAPEPRNKRWRCAAIWGKF